MLSHGPTNGSDLMDLQTASSVHGATSSFPPTINGYDPTPGPRNGTSHPATMYASLRGMQLPGANPQGSIGEQPDRFTHPNTRDVALGCDLGDQGEVNPANHPDSSPDNWEQTSD